MDECKHPTISAEDAGYEQYGVRQAIAVCHECGKRGLPAPGVDDAITLFWLNNPAMPELEE